MSTDAPVRTWPSTALRYLPGLLLLLVVGIVGTFAQTGLRSLATATGSRLPDIEYVLWAIVIGLLIRNTIGVAALFRPGVATYEFWLKIGIVLLGALSTRRSRQARRVQPRADPHRHGGGHHRDPARRTRLRAQRQAVHSACHRHVDLRRLGDHRRQGRDRRG
jgi:hypothetical protein